MCQGLHDAQELLMWLLDALHEDLNRVRRQAAETAYQRVAVDGAHLAQAGQERCAAEAWRRHLLRNRSVVVDLFQGQIRSQLRCPQCGLLSVTFDPFLYLTLPLPVGQESISLDDAVRLFCREEALDEDNAWECGHCCQRVAACKKLDLWKLPTLLCVNLKRFEWFQSNDGGPAAFQARKLDCSVDFPQECFDFGPLVAVEAPQKEPLVYNLVSVVDHLGAHLDSGHYVATCRRPDGWFRFDDNFVTPVPPEVTAVNRHNYLLLFERAGTPVEPTAIAEQRASAPLAWPHVIDIDWSFLSGGSSDEQYV